MTTSYDLPGSGNSYMQELLALIQGFEYELCSDCGKDIEAHNFLPDPLGHPHAWCVEGESEFLPGQYHHDKGRDCARTDEVLANYRSRAQVAERALIEAHELGDEMATQMLANGLRAGSTSDVARRAWRLWRTGKQES